MTEHHADAYSHGDMDIQAHEDSFHTFTLMAKWGSLHVATALVFLVLWFCTPAGFGGALITAIVVSALGFLLLRPKPGAAH